MKVGLFGAGRIGELHARTLAEHGAVADLTVFDPVSARARALASAVGTRVAESADEVIEGADAVVIASSTDTHVDFLLAAAEAGLPAFCEKPIAADLAGTDRAIDAVERAGIPVMMGFNRRFDSGFRNARDAVRSGSLGTLLLIIGQHHDHMPSPEEYIAGSGGQFKDQLIHDFDLLRFVSGQEVVAVHAAGGVVGAEIYGKYDDTSVSTVTLWLESGALASLSGVRLDPIGYDVRMEVFGTGDSLALGLDDQTPIRSVEPGRPPPTHPYREWMERFGDSYVAEMDAFLQMAVGRIESPCTVYDARAALEIAEACRRSLSAGVPVDLGRRAGG